jgi:glycosyltransferase involved in cell wall biosynthesis
VSGPRVSIVVVTHRRAELIPNLLASMRAQTLPTEDFELIVVDNNEDDETRAVLHAEADGLPLQVEPVEHVLSLAAARNVGWKVARAPLVGFLDDDCTAAPEWLEVAVRVAERKPGTLFQGRVEPDPADLDVAGPYTRTVRVASRLPYFNVNVFYPRTVLEELGGLDEEAYGVSLGGGEDTDLGWRAIEIGTPIAFAPEACVYHPIQHLGPIGKLRVAARWHTIPLTYSRHPGLRKADLDYGIFWKNHYLVVRALIALALPKRIGPVPLSWLRRWLGWPYLAHLVVRMREDNATPLHFPYLFVHDVIELVTIARGAVRYRTLVL